MKHTLEYVQKCCLNTTFTSTTDTAACLCGTAQENDIPCTAAICGTDETEMRYTAVPGVLITNMYGTYCCIRMYDILKLFCAAAAAAAVCPFLNLMSMAQEYFVPCFQDHIVQTCKYCNVRHTPP